jgi:hypothetical protein
MNGLVGAAFGLMVFAAWITHIYHGFADEAWGWFIAGMIFFPVGIVNGIGIWFGWWS